MKSANSEEAAKPGETADPGEVAKPSKADPVAGGLVAGVLVAAGRSVRMGSDKLWIELWGRPVWRWALDTLLALPELARLVLVVPPEARERFRAGLPREAMDRCLLVAGGEERADSVLAGLGALTEAGTSSATLVLVHDAARPGVSVELARAVVDAAREVGAALPVLAVTDTLKSIRDARAVETIERTGLGAAQTPQVASLGALRDALEAARARGERPTDEAAALAAMGVPVAAVAGEASNAKLTGPGDEATVRLFLRDRAVPLAAQSTHGPRPGMRSGVGLDAHRLTDGRPMRLGGLAWPGEPRGLAGHSDGDVAIHAVIDALLGAAHLGDIGALFGSDDPAWQGADSADLLRRSLERVRAAGWRPVWVDLAVIGEQPVIARRRKELEARLAELIGLPPDAVSVKGTTADGLGLPGGEGVAAYAVAVVKRGT